MFKSNTVKSKVKFKYMINFNKVSNYSIFIILLIYRLLFSFKESKS